MSESLLVVYPHAYKHGLTESQICEAWESADKYVKRYYADDSIDIVCIGYSAELGDYIELVAEVKDFGIGIYHANTPPTQSIREEVRYG